MKTLQYLSRINFNIAPQDELQLLATLHRSHMLHVPFENLDIHNSTPIILDTEKFFQKIVLNRRGGFCYELNGLFHMLLSSLGFKAHLISCGVYVPSANIYGAYFGHVAILVELDDLWLVDVGFGDSFLEPVKISLGEVQYQDGIYYRTRQLTEDEFVLEKSDNAVDFTSMYRFRLTPQSLSDFTDMCAFHQTSTLSPFTKGRLCSIARPNGRITLTETNLIERTGKEKTERPLNGLQEFREKLKEHFGIAELEAA